MNEHSAHRRSDLEALLGPILERAIALTGFEKGNIQLFDQEAGALSIVCQQGFSADFLETFARVAADTTCACGRALKARRFVFIGDVSTDAEYAPYRDAAREAGYRSVLSLPIMSAESEVVGMMSVHHAQPQAALPVDISYLGEFAAAMLSRQSLID